MNDPNPGCSLRSICAAGALALGVATTTTDAGVYFDGAPYNKRILSRMCAGPPADCDGPCIWLEDEISVPFLVVANGGSRLTCVRTTAHINGFPVFDDVVYTSLPFYFGTLTVLNPNDFIFVTECAEVVSIVYTVHYSQVPDDSPCGCPKRVDGVDDDDEGNPACAGRRVESEKYIVTLKCIPCDSERPLKMNGIGGIRLPWRPLPEDLEFPWSFTNAGDAPEVVEISSMSSAPWLAVTSPPELVTIEPGETIAFTTTAVRLPDAPPGSAGQIAIVAKSLENPAVFVRESVQMRVFELPFDDCDIEGDVSCFVPCHPDAGSCFEANPTAACDDPFCCAVVCDFDPFCCLESWDATCVSATGLLCPSK